MAEISLKAIEDLCAQLARAERVITALIRYREAKTRGGRFNAPSRDVVEMLNAKHELDSALAEYDRPSAPSDNP